MSRHRRPRWAKDNTVYTCPSTKCGWEYRHLTGDRWEGPRYDDLSWDRTQAVRSWAEMRDGYADCFAAIKRKVKGQ